MTTNTFSEFSVINDVVNRWPETVAIFAAYGLDTCCGGGKSIAEAARLHSVNLSELLNDLTVQIASPTSARGWSCPIPIQ